MDRIFAPFAALVLLAALCAAAPTAAAQDGGEILWSVELGLNFVIPAATVAPDGTLYINSEDLFAIAPDGSIRWTATLFGAHVVGLGDDGTVYATSGAEVFAFSPDGELLWTFTEDPSGGGFMAGPSVGPDGNVYAVTDTLSGGLGAFSLTPDGDLRWNVSGFEDHQPFGIVNRPVPFGADRLYWAFDRVPGCESTGLISILLDGIIAWCAETAGYSGPEVGPGGNVHLSSTDLRTYDSSGELLWTAPVIQPGEPAAAPDGAVFLFGESYDLRAFEPDGSQLWTVEDAADGNFPAEPAVAPDGAALVFGTGHSFGTNGAIHAHDPVTGAELWTTPLTGSSEGAVGPPAFSPDGEVVYVPVTSSTRSRLLALRVHDAAGALALSPPDPGIAGAENCYGVTGASPGGDVGLAMALRSGETVPPGCTTALDLEEARPRDLATADGSGSATLCTFVPGEAAGRTLLAQAVDFDAPGCAVSNVDATTFE